MELMQGIESWIITVVYLGLMIFCLAQVRKKGMGFLATGFALSFIARLGWPLLSLVIHYLYYMDIGLIYTIWGQINFVLQLGSALFFILGIYQFTRSFDKKDSDVTQTHQFKDPAPPRKFGSVGFYVSMLVIGFLLMVLGILLIFVINANRGYGSDTGFVIVGISIFIGIIMMIIAWIYFVVLLYRVWKFAIVESRRHNLAPSIDSPGIAVGFLFIPFFNFYWIFKAYGSLPRNLNAIARAKNISAVMSEGLGISLAILCLLSMIPFLGYILSLVVLILAPIFISSSISMCKKLSEVSNAPQ